MRHATTASLIAAALAAGTIYATQDPPECEPGEPFMLVAAVHVPETHDDEGDTTSAHCIRVPVTTTCGQPLELAAPVPNEETPIPCGDLAPGEVRRVLTAEAYPDSIVGLVGRHANESETWPTAAVAPHWGICQGTGCHCAGEPDECEHIPLGGPNSTADDPPYWCRRLYRLNPEAPCD